MGLTDEEFELILNDNGKQIIVDIRWKDDEDHSPSVEFIVPLENSFGHPMTVRGSYNVEAQTVSFVILLGGTGRIYALDLGSDHKNPRTLELLGRKHKHKWTEQFKDKWAYVPQDITVGVDNLEELWKQFCIEANINHVGRFHLPPPRQREFDL